MTPTSGIADVDLEYHVYQILGNTLTDLGLYDTDRGCLDLSTLEPALDYWLRVESIGSIPTEYEISFSLAATSDAGEYNNSATSARRIENIHNIARIRGLTLDEPTDEDWFRFTLRGQGGTGDRIDLELSAAGYVTLRLFDDPTSAAVATVATHAGGVPGTDVSLDLSGYPQGDYWVQVSIDTAQTGHQPVRYELRPLVGQAAVGNNSTRTGACELVDFTHLQPIRQTLAGPDAAAWFTFTLTETAPDALGLILQSLGDDGLPLDSPTVLVAELTNNRGDVLARAQNAAGQALAVLDLGGLPAGVYWVSVRGANASELTAIGLADSVQSYPVQFQLSSTVALRDKLVLDLSGATVVDLAGFAPMERRDVILGGPGDDRLQGGSHEEWIFGQDGNDVLTGGLDEQASDLLFGGDGDDIFQIVPDRLPVAAATGRRGDPASSDLFIGGGGIDQVLFLGGDAATDDDPSVNPHMVRDLVAIGYDRFLHRHRLTSLIWDVANEQFVGEDVDGDGNVDVYQQLYAFFQAIDVEETVIDTRGGRDIVHADPNYILNGQTWGVGYGDVEAGATAFARLEIRGSGQDVIYGGVSSDTIYGQEGHDFISGGMGDDRILGDDADDFVYGNSWAVGSCPAGLSAALAGTPDASPVPPAPGAKPRVLHRFEIDLASPLDRRCASSPALISRVIRLRLSTWRMRSPWRV